MTAFMLDIEALGTRIDSKVTQVSAVQFDPHGDSIGESFDMFVNLDGQQERTLTTDTLAFWSKFPDTFKKMIEGCKYAETLPVVLVQLANWMEDQGEVIETSISLSADPITIWANGITYDLSILTHAAEQHQVRCYWGRQGRFRNLRCMRGLKDIVFQKAMREANGVIEPYNPQIEVDMDEWTQTEFEPHNALHDCIYQAKLVQAYFKFLRS